MRFGFVLALAALPLAGCQRSIEGTYNMENGPVAGVVMTFGVNQFSLSSGPSGTYERSGDTIILNGQGFRGTYRIEGDKLVGDRITFTRRSPDDSSPIYRGPRAGYGNGDTAR